MFSPEGGVLTVPEKSSFKSKLYTGQRIKSKAWMIPNRNLYLFIRTWRTIFGRKRNEEIWGRINLYNKELHSLCSTSYNAKANTWRKMCWECCLARMVKWKMSTKFQTELWKGGGHLWEFMVLICGLWWCGSNTVDLGKGPVVRSYEHASKTSGFVGGRPFLEQLTEKEHLKNCITLNYIYMH
jgi:hypothetical protein